MSRMLSRAEAYYITGRYMWKIRYRDEAYVDVCCISSSLCIELCLMYLLQCSAITYAKNSSFGNLFELLPNTYRYTDWYKTLYPMSTELCDWCIKPASSDDFTVDEKTLGNVQAVLPSLLSDCILK